MKIKENSILITGGATGIGFALTETLVKAGNVVTICGRRQHKLEEARVKIPQLRTVVCDVSDKENREQLYKWVEKNLPGINILINNAGIQRAIDFSKGIEALTIGENETEINFAAPIHLAAHFIPLLMKQSEAAIINVSSGLGFVPMAVMPVYCATKAGLHSFTLSLRHQLRNTSVKVFEVIPPRVATALGREPDQISGGIPPTEVATAVVEALENNEYEIAVGGARDLVDGSRTDPEQMFKNLNQWQ